jgi:transcription-repair coupling factor (superfamily II helicase)
MKAELKDRFGDYPPEVESLFAVVELKILAAELRLHKIQISGNLLTLWLPPETDTLFYDGRNGSSSILQKVVDGILPKKEFRAQLRQDGRQLKLMVRFPDHATRESILRPSMELLQQLRQGEATA